MFLQNRRGLSFSSDFLKFENEISRSRVENGSVEHFQKQKKHTYTQGHNALLQVRFLFHYKDVLVVQLQCG